MKTWSQILKLQKELCAELEVELQPIKIDSLVAVNSSLFSSTQPINGLRHKKEGTIDGLYLWSGGEIPQGDVDFFKPLHVEHIIEKREVVLKYLGLPEGWRFQIDDKGYEDLWFDETLLDV